MGTRRRRYHVDIGNGPCVAVINAQPSYRSNGSRSRNDPEHVIEFVHETARGNRGRDPLGPLAGAHDSA
jgi:hypothetical protein